MSEDEIRRALETLASHPPQHDRKPGVHARIGAARRRRQIGTGIAASVMALFTGIAVTALPARDRNPSDGMLRTASSTPTPAPLPSALPPSPEASPPAVVTQDATGPAVALSAQVTVPTAGSSRPAAPATAAPKVAQRPTAAATVTETHTQTQTQTVTSPAAIPTRPVVVVKPPTTSAPVTPSSSAPVASATSSAPVTPVSPTSPSAAAESLTTEITAVTAQDGSPAPETTITVKVRGSIYGSVSGVTLWYTTVHRLAYSGTQARSCTVRDGALHEVDESYTFSTRYRVAGPQQVDAVLTTIGADCDRAKNSRQWPASATISIPVGSALTNGVAPAQLTVANAAVQSSRITLNATAADPDGYVNSFTVNWGSGLPDTFPGGGGANCAATESGGAFWPEGEGSGTFTSRVLTPGTYTVTVSATTTGCDGGHAQTAQQTITVTVP